MKSINFRGYRKPDKDSIYTIHKKYCFWLPGRFFYFGSERTCLAFMAQCSDFFSLKLYTLNKLYPELFSIWRDLWMYDIDYQTEKMIISEFNNLEIHLNKCSYHGKNADDSALPYNNLIKSCSNMIELCRLFKSVHDKRSSTTLKKDMLLLIHRIEHIQSEMHNYTGPADVLLKPEKIEILREHREAMLPDMPLSLT